MFKIKRRIARRPPVYTLEEYDGTSIIGTFYEQELQKVEDKDFFRIEKILKKTWYKPKKQRSVGEMERISE